MTKYNYNIFHYWHIIYPSIIIRETGVDTFYFVWLIHDSALSLEELKPNYLSYILIFKRVGLQLKRKHTQNNDYKKQNKNRRQMTLCGKTQVF